VTRINFLFAALLAFVIAVPALAQAQAPAPQSAQSSPDEVGNVASVQGSATVTRRGTPGALKVRDPIFKGDVLSTGPGASLGITFDDETTFNLSANASIDVDNFLYDPSGKSNAALFKVVRGTVAFAAHAVAKTGDMKIETPSSTLGIRGTTGVIDVPPGATPGTPGEVAVKLYADADGKVGRIELFGNGGGPSLGLLTRAATGFSLRAGGGGRFSALPLTISAEQIARDRSFVQRTFAARNLGRSLIQRRLNIRFPNRQRSPNLRQPGQQQQKLLQPKKQKRAAGDSTQQTSQSLDTSKSRGDLPRPSRDGLGPSLRLPTPTFRAPPFRPNGLR
jgi:hypothetical protein